VDPEEALAELGLEAPASAEAIRRAYLRAVREHPPERDADGFRRVREAYDLLRQAPWRWIGKHEPVAMPGVVVQEAPREPVEQESAEPSEFVVTPRDEANDVDEAPAPSAPAATEAPAPRTEALVTPKAPRAAVLVVEAHQAVRAGKTNRASRLLLELLTAPEHRDFSQIPTWQTLEAALGLIEAGKLAQARELVEALDRRVTALGLGATEIGPAAIARWTLVSELLALEVGSDDLILALAQGVQSGDFDDALAVFKELRTKRGLSFERAFMAKAPSLYKTLASELRPRGVRTHFTWWRWLWIGYVILQFGRCAAPSFEQQLSSHATHSTQAPRELAKNDVAKPDADPDRGLLTTTRSIDDAVQRGDCNTVREQWSDYLKALHPPNLQATRNKDEYSVRRQQALAMCRELGNELPEVP
jgi:hypothetical protein